MATSAACAAVVFLWRRQDRKEARITREANIKDAINAVWATAKVGDNPQPIWGILVTNTLRSPVTNVLVACTGNLKSTELHHPRLEPGEHFFASSAKNDIRSWALPSNQFEIVNYITASSKHTTTKVDFIHSGTPYSKVIIEAGK